MEYKYFFGQLCGSDDDCQDDSKFESAPCEHFRRKMFAIPLRMLIFDVNNSLSYIYTCSRTL